MSLPVQILYAREELLLEPIWDVMQAPAYLNFKFFFFFFLVLFMSLIAFFGTIHESHYTIQLVFLFFSLSLSVSLSLSLYSTFNKKFSVSAK